MSRVQHPNSRYCSFIFGMAALLLTNGAVAQTASAEKPIRMVIGFPPGSQADALARLFGQRLGEARGKPVVIDNVTGAAGNIASDRVAKAAPDGYTLGLLAQGQMVVNPSLYKLAFDTLLDFAPVSQVASSPLMLVIHNAVPAKNIKQLAALAKAQPAELTFASAGSGSTTHMSAELFRSVAGINILHIPYKGAPSAMPDLLSGRVMMMFSPIVVALPMVREGRLRALAVTSIKRSSVVPELPSIAESGYPGFDVTQWYGLLAPVKTSATSVRTLHLETTKALAPDLRAKLTALGLDAIGNSPEEFAAAIKSEIPKWAKVIKDAGIKVD